MNRRRKFDFKKVLLVCMLIGALLGVQVVEVLAISPNEMMAEVSTISELVDAIDAAKDGDVIGLNGFISIPSNITIGNSTKHITIKRLKNWSCFSLDSGKGIKFRDVTLDGNAFTSSTNLISLHSGSDFSVVFEDVKFQNCVSDGIGGAAYLECGTAIFKDCIFTNNSALYGGHLGIIRNANVTIENCTFTKGDAQQNGGAIYFVSDTSTCTIKSSTITGNTANVAGGGIANNGVIKIEKTKLFGNTAAIGGSDIANHELGQLTLVDTLDDLQKLFTDYEFNPIGWIRDYDSDIPLHDIDTSDEYALLKLAFEERKTEPPVDPNPTDPPEESTPESPDQGKEDETDTPEKPGEESSKPDQGNEDDTGSQNPDPTPSPDKPDDKDPNPTPSPSPDEDKKDDTQVHHQIVLHPPLTIHQ